MPASRPRPTVALALVALLAASSLGSVAAMLPASTAHPVAAATACTPSDPLPPLLAQAGLVPFTEDPDAGAWAPFLVPASEVPVPAPPATASPVTASELVELHQYALNRTTAQRAEALFWDAGGASSPWMETYLELVIVHNIRGPWHGLNQTSREAALLGTAMHDALVAAWQAKACYQRPPPWALDPALALTAEGTKRPVPSYPSEHAVAAGVALTMFLEFFPCRAYPYDCEERPERLWHLAAGALESRLVLGLNYRSDVEAGFALGRAVAERALAARADDGFHAPWDGQRSTGPCTWQPTPPAFAPTPRMMNLATVRPWVLASAAALRPAPPPACGSAEDLALLQAVHAQGHLGANLTEAQKALALRWNYGAGTETLAGALVWDTLNESKAANLTTMQGARVAAHVAVAAADAVVASWDAKAAYWSERPVTGIRRSLEPGWMSYLLPGPWPQDASEHAAVAGAGLGTLAHFFPDRAADFEARAADAALAPVYGGLADSRAAADGAAVGAGVAAAVIARAQAS